MRPNLFTPDNKQQAQSNLTILLSTHIPIGFLFSENTKLTLNLLQTILTKESSEADINTALLSTSTNHQIFNDVLRINLQTEPLITNNRQFQEQYQEQSNCSKKVNYVYSGAFGGIGGYLFTATLLAPALWISAVAGGGTGGTIGVMAWFLKQKIFPPKHSNAEEYQHQIETALEGLKQALRNIMTPSSVSYQAIDVHERKTDNPSLQ